MSTPTTTDNSQSDESTTIKPGEPLNTPDQPEQGEVEDLSPPTPPATDGNESPAKTERDDSGFGTTGMFDRFKNKASKVGKAAQKRARQVQNRSASRDAERASDAIEHVTSEVTATMKGLFQSATAILVGGTYGTISGAVKGTLPTHAKLLQQSDDLRLAGNWNGLRKGVETDDGLIDVFDVEFNDPTCSILGLNESNGTYPVDRKAVHTTITEPGNDAGEKVEVIASPVYDRQTDRLIGVLAFVNEGRYAGRILLSIEEDGE